MKPYYREATVKDALLVANNLRDEDRSEIEGLGQTPISIVFWTLLSEPCYAFFNHEGEIGGIAGITKDPRPNTGIIWMLCTPAITKNPVTFVRQAKQWLSEYQDNYILWNLADARNTFHHKLLKLLGFKAIRSVPSGPYQLPYLEIVKLCVNPLQRQ